jgi:hypothetical protein
MILFRLHGINSFDINEKIFLITKMILQKQQISAEVPSIITKIIGL